VFKSVLAILTVMAVLAAYVLPSGVPPHTGVELGNEVGAVAATTTEPDKT